MRYKKSGKKEREVQPCENQNDTTLNIESLPDGVYFLKLQSGSGSKTQTLVKH